MTETNPSTAAGSTASAAQVAKLEQQVAALSERIDVQGAVQLEIAKLLQSFHAAQTELPQQIAEILREAIMGIATETAPMLHETVNNLEMRLNNILANMHPLKQVTNLTLRRMSYEGGKIRCVFIVQSIAMWDALADIYWAMTKDERFHPMVVSIDQSHLARAEFTGEEDVHKGLMEMNIPHLRLNLNSLDALDILRNLSPDVIFRQQQWDAPVPPGLRTPEITFARICVVPYGMGVLANPRATDETDEAYDNNYDQVYHRLAWRIFCETEQTRCYYTSFDHSDPDKFILTGYPKLDKLMEAKGKGSWPIPEPNGRSFRIIWAPHHSLVIQHQGFGVFHRIYRQMLDWARMRPDIQIVFKPHPALDHTARHLPPEVGLDYDDFLRTWSALPNCAVYTGNYGELFDASDLMITDGVSFLTEYHLFEKPLIFLDSGARPRFNALGRLAEAAADRVDTFEEMREAALGYKNGKAFPFEKERQELLRVLRPRSEPASEIILNSIAEGIYSSRI
ncbi:CDP-glycerol glycerophosphotransferase family protein [Rhizobium oryzicola]|uniref:CDP-glycerol glycerophosphotransferase family protein n=1 Tax=Rhizobium oryzicola TaxID=1232668 RepID=A0ABT8SRG3_9HYPH|nr:CDP-glycerol glycerophosphotransferase family protein [Rhizobium oryzicola]MDO1581020.1 CDP-glycerol glycerophosphotransferase family protein [Rhizobium oryzicola]